MNYSIMLLLYFLNYNFFGDNININISKTDSLKVEINYIEYYQIINNAEESFCNHDYVNAIDWYKKAFIKCPPIKRDLINYSRCLIKEGKVSYDSIRNILLSCAEQRGGFLSNNLLKDSILVKIYNKDFFDSIIKLEKRDKHSLPDDVQLILDLDRLPRMKEEYFNSIHIIDSFVVGYMTSYISKNGWPGYRRFGTDITSRLMVHWVDSADFSRIHELLYNELKIGNIFPLEYGLFLDRWYSYKCQCGLDLGYTKIYCINDDDYLLAKKRRYDIGLFYDNLKLYRFYKLSCEE